jgi:cation efflux system membrane fusion protein
MRYQYSLLLQTIISLGILTTTPQITTAHVGHGDEFQATGGIQRVEVKPETDQILGIMVTPIAPATDGSNKVMIPITALVDADGKQLVFVQYENFYEPVEVTIGTTQGELIEVTNGLSVGEKLVNQGSLSLYAESRKTNNVETTATTGENISATSSPTTNPSAITTDASNTVTESETLVSQTPVNETKTDGVSIGKVVPLFLLFGVAGVLGSVAFGIYRKKQADFSEDEID